MPTTKDCCSQHVLTLNTMNPNFVNIQYAVRGPIVQRANELEEKLRNGDKAAFSEVIKCNIGDCHATGQNPITFGRQLIAALTLSQLLDEMFIPDDVKKRATEITNCCGGGSVGSYSHSLGISKLRQDVTSYISRRDGVPANFNDIFLSAGASEAVKFLLNLVSTGRLGADRAGIMVPIPQYPLYSASTAEFNLYQIDYYLDEEKEWALSTDELERALNQARDKCQPRMLVVINPGNPTGQVLSRSCMEDVIRFAMKHRLVLLADEVYQHNIYDPEHHPWISFKRVLCEMEPEIAQTLELASVMSCSKGFMGECGFRGGYCELVNFDPKVQGQLYKALSARLCPPVVGQAMVEVFANPPEPHEPSYETYVKERNAVLSELQLKASIVSTNLNMMTGIRCNPVQGAMYAFPRIELPKKAIQAAREKNQEPDFFYCLQFLEEKGVCVVPGSGFGQYPGTYHFRITILPSLEKMKYVMNQLRDFHSHFMLKYAD